MLKLLKRWLGWDSDTGLFDFSDLQITPRQRPVPTSNPTPPPPAVKPPAAAQPKERPTAGAAPPAAPTPPAAPKPKKDRSPMDVLDDPRLTLDRPNADGFDPYNTGAFNRSTSWERIGRQKKR